MDRHIVLADSIDSMNGTPVHPLAAPSHLHAAAGPEGLAADAQAGMNATTTTTSTDKALRKSCQHCRKRKIKCLSIAGSSACKACAAKGQPCLFEKQSQMGRPPKAKTAAAAAGELRASASASSSSSSSPPPADASARQHADPAGPASPRKRRSSHAGAVDPRQLPKKQKNLAGSDSAAAASAASHEHGYMQSHQQHAYASYHIPFASSSSTSLHQPLHISPEWQQPEAYTPTSATALSSASSSSNHPLGLLPSSLARLPTSHASTPLSAAPASSRIAPPHPGAICVQTETDPLPFFRNGPLHSLAAAFHHILSSSANHLVAVSTPPILGDPRISSMARIRTLTARATAIRKPVDRSEQAATPTYARSLISPLWDGLPVDIIALTTTGKPSASGPFSIASEVSKRSPPQSGPASAHEEYLYVKLLREDESSEFNLSPVRHASASVDGHAAGQKGLVFTKESPGFRYAPDKATIGKFFTGYFSKHPLAPLVLNERIFLDDLINNRIDPLLLHVIVGSSIARAPCLGAGNDDAEDVGNEFFCYIESELLARRVDGVSDIQTCQALMLWATHELTHMRVRRANALWNTADVLLRQRVSAFHARVGEEATYNSMLQAGHDMSGLQTPIPLGWRDLVEQELTVNCLWVIVIWNTWTSLSLKLPHNTMSIMAQSLPVPPQNVGLSSSFAFAYPQPTVSSPLQAVVRRTIERFSDMTQLINVIVTLKNQNQAKNLFAPDPPRPLAVIDDEEAQIATWLVDLAKYYHADMADDKTIGLAGQQQLVQQSRLSDNSRAFLVASHAVLALHQILPYATSSSNSYGSPMPLPTVESLRTALSALHLAARSIQLAAPGTRTRTQAILLDSMPRILSLLDVFTSSALSSLDHFVLVTSQRDAVHELLDDLNRAVASMNPPSVRAPNLDSCEEALDKSSKSLRTVVDIGSELQNRQHAHVSYGQIPDGRFTSHYGPHGLAIQPLALPGTPSTSPSSQDGAPWQGTQSQQSQPYLAWTQPDHGSTFPIGIHRDIMNVGTNAYSNAQASSLTSFGHLQHSQPNHISMSSHLANSPLMRMPDSGTILSPSFVGSLHAYL